MKEFLKRKAEENEEELKKFFKKYFDDSIKKARSEIQNFNEDLQTLWNIISKKVKDYLDDSSSFQTNSYYFKSINGISSGISICKKFNFDTFLDKLIYNYTMYLGSYIEIAFAIIPNIDVGICIDLGTEINWKDKEYGFYFDIYGLAEVAVSLEIGAYVPGMRDPIKISISLGLKGVLGAGKVGMKLTFFIGDNKYAIKLYTEFEAFRFSFYILFKFEIEKFIYFSFEFYIYNKSFSFFVFIISTTLTKKFNSNKIKTDSGFFRDIVGDKRYEKW